MARTRYTNLPNTDLSTTQQNLSAEQKTKTFFDGYFEQDVKISGAEWDLVYAFAKKKTQNEEAARSLAEAIVTSADALEDDPQAIIKQLSQYEGLELDQVLSLYFNETRRDTSLLGFSQTITPNKYVSRNIRA